ncbi:hypothetical protein F4810DRAFT_722577 [Camillea tinctor]|nr:hypothetical protein F4810DRAFT_722577 [Camillea tinctor]
MPSPKPELRKRRYQTRSRGGCITCKAKHIRCDEKKPLCTNCLVKGGKCGYAVSIPAATGEFRTTHRSGTLWSQGKVSSSLDHISNLSLVDYPTTMTHESLAFFKIFTRHQGVVNESPTQPMNYFLIHRAFSNPALLHFILLLSCIRWTWDTGSMQQVRRSYLHHKLEAIKFVNEQLEDPKTALADSTIASIVGLALAESALGNLDIAMAHMSGLAKIVQMRDTEAASSANTFLGLTIMIFMGASETSIREFLDVLGDVEVQRSLALYTCHTTGDTFTKDARTGALSMVHDILENSAPRRVTGELGSRVPPTISESWSRLKCCYLLVFVILGTGSIDPFVINWLIEWMLMDLCLEEETVRRGEFPGKLWFWGAMKSMCTVAATRATSDLEALQIDKWKAMCQEKIRRVARTTGLTTWEQVQETLVSLAWDDELTKEYQLREMWEEAVFGQNVIMMPAVAPYYVDRYDFMSIEERERSISMVQINSMGI